MQKRYILTAALGMILTIPSFGQTMDGFSRNSVEKQKNFEKQFLETVDFTRFKTHLEAITSVPHPAGSEANEKVKDYLVKTMEDAGLDVKVYPYDVWLTKGQGESLVEIVRPKRQPLNQQEDILDDNPYSSHPDLKKGWNAFSGSGDVTAEVVYANYGTKADFEKLNELGIDVEGKIVLARYGGNFRGFKAKFAEEYGAAGLLIYTDPGDAGYMKGPVYPDGIYYNESSVQRGSLLTVPWTGDALTPFEPALPVDGKEKIERKKPEEVGLHTIPVTSIPYGSAKEIIGQMKGKAVPAGWQGGLPFSYSLEGGPELKVRLMVEQEQGYVKANNVIGTVKGEQFPDEWVILGCHFDAWSFGSTDPNSGTAMLLSMSETLGKLAKEGTRPARSILIAHWDAEEHGVIGSTEWVEHYREELGAKGVAYINLDAAVSGRNFNASASPTMKKILIESAKGIAFPDSSKSVFDVWAGKKDEPTIGNLGGGSDHIAFYMHLGIPSLNAGASGPTLYHTNYDDLYFYENFADPSYQMGGTVEQLIGTVALRLANAEIIPYNLTRYAKDLEGHFKNAEQGVKSFDPTFLGFEKSKASLVSLKSSAESLEEKIGQKLAESSPERNRLKEINKALIDLEKSFIDEKGMYFGSWYRSLYASTDPFSGYASWILPGIQYEIEMKSSERLEEWDGRYQAAINDLKNKIEQLEASLIDIQSKK